MVGGGVEDGVGEPLCIPCPPTEAVAGLDVKVRRVKLFYRTRETGSGQETERAIQTIILLCQTRE